MYVGMRGSGRVVSRVFAHGRTAEKGREWQQSQCENDDDDDDDGEDAVQNPGTRVWVLTSF